jgi:8-oxo-dGTP pyrophosphatase MutT (NUDIX family)
MKRRKYRKALFIITYARTKKGVEYLLLKRKLHWKGWEFPKGAIKFFETRKRAVKRELKEETGLEPIKIKKFDYSGKYNYNKMSPDRPGITGQTFMLYSAEVKKGKVKIDKLEHSGYKWVSLHKAVKMLKWPNQKKSLKIINEWLERESH